MSCNIFYKLVLYHKLNDIRSNSHNFPNFPSLSRLIVVWSCLGCQTSPSPSSTLSCLTMSLSTPVSDSSVGRWGTWDTVFLIVVAFYMFKLFFSSSFFLVVVVVLFCLFTCIDFFSLCLQLYVTCYKSVTYLFIFLHLN